MPAKFGPAGNSDSFKTMGYKHSLQVPEYIVKMGLDCFEPKGAFYVFPCIKSTGLSSEEFCEKLLRSKKVAVVPGGAFGSSGEGFVRVSYAYSLDHIMEAAKRIKEFIEELK